MEVQIVRLQKDDRTKCKTGGLDWGKLTGTPTVIKGAVTMKTINKTNITSIRGVTLMSLTGRVVRRLEES